MRYILTILFLAAIVQGQDADKAVADFLWLDTDPSGAEVVFDGKEYGQTPMIIQNLKAGEHTVVFKKKGFKDLSQECAVPNDGQRMTFGLELKPGACMVDSEPRGASVFEGPHLLGRTPLVLLPGEIMPGQHKFDVSKVGYEAVELELEVSKTEGSQVKAALIPQFGDLRLTVVPAIADIVIDGTNFGSLEQLHERTLESKERVIKDLLAGQRTVRLERGGQHTEGEVVTIEPGKETKKDFIFWYPDTRITTPDGEKHDIMTVCKRENGNLLTVTKDNKMREFAVDDIKNKTPIPRDEAANLVRKMRIRRIMERKKREAKGDD